MTKGAGRISNPKIRFRAAPFNAKAPFTASCAQPILGRERLPFSRALGPLSRLNYVTFCVSKMNRGTKHGERLERYYGAVKPGSGRT
jgi:hypothetical protein